MTVPAICSNIDKGFTCLKFRYDFFHIVVKSIVVEGNLAERGDMKSCLE